MGTPSVFHVNDMLCGLSNSPSPLACRLYTSPLYISSTLSFPFFCLMNLNFSFSTASQYFGSPCLFAIKQVRLKYP